MDAPLPDRAGAGRDAVIEVGPLFELDDFEAGKGVQRFRELGVGSE